MFSLLHLHFESVLRAVASVRPNDLKKLYRSFRSAQYRAAPPAQRLRLLERHIQQLSQHNDIFTEQVFRHVVQGFFKELEQNQVGHVELRIGITTKKWTWMETIVEGIQVFECERQAHPHISLSFLGALNFAKPFAEIDEIFEILLDNCSIREKFVGVDINVLPEDFHKFVQYTPPSWS